MYTNMYIIEWQHNFTSYLNSCMIFSSAVSLVSWHNLITNKAYLELVLSVQNRSGILPIWYLTCVVFQC